MAQLLAVVQHLTLTARALPPYAPQTRPPRHFMSFNDQLLIVPEPDVLPTHTEVFCNRALNMAQIQAVGFDMDYTLAEYLPHTFDLLAFDGALQKLVDMGYPEKILTFQYDPFAFQRGLVIDKARGNILKLDRHKYVKVAYHGLEKMSSDERKALYNVQLEKQFQFSPPDFTSIDTDFLLVDASLFSQLVTYKDKHPGEIGASYATIYKNVRRAVDLCHCDGVIKDSVAVSPSRYIRASPELPRMLTQLRLAGKQVFILTNSLYDYTDLVCRYLLGPEWESYFDLVICGARKPGFLLDPYLPLFQVRKDGSLVNIEMAGPQDADKVLSQSRVFQGGNWNQLHALLGLTSGANLLYVGDHMYSDILRSKRTLGWRTLLIVPELESDLKTLAEDEERGEFIAELQTQRSLLDAQVRRLALQRLELELDPWASAAEAMGKGISAETGYNEASYDSEEPGAEETEMLAALDAELEACREQQALLKTELAEALEGHHLAFHSRWGRLFKAGYQNSRWAQQVQEYACLYTARATNLVYFSPDYSFRTAPDLMPHDRI